MKFFGSTAVIVLAIVVKDVLSYCPEGGCECGQFCVDINNKWCNSNNDSECSCKKGCLIFDQLMKTGDQETIYCAFCICGAGFYGTEDGKPFCTTDDYCIPNNLTVNVDYPASEGRSPNCKDLGYKDYD